MLRYFVTGMFLCSAAFSQEGTRVYIAHCQQCHDQNSDAHAPLPAALATKPWQEIVKTLESGLMRAQGAQLTPQERLAVARYLGKSGPVEVPTMTGQCPASQKPVTGAAAWNGWSPDERNTRFQPATAASLTAGQLPELQFKWAFGYPNAVTAYGQPTVVGGRVYNGSNDGTVYAIDANTGCLYWRFQAKAMVRNAIVIGPRDRAYFGDLEANMYALDSKTGKLIWQKKVDDQAFTRITGTVKLHEGRLYIPIASQEENAGANPYYSCCTFRGAMVSLNARDGSLAWKTYTSPASKPTWKSKDGIQYYGPSGATIWSSPTLDLKRKLLYVATGNGYSDPEIQTADAIVALDMATGKIRWSRQAEPDMFNWDCGPNGAQGPQKGNCPEKAGRDVDFGASPILADLDNGKQILLAGQKSGVVWGFDPGNEGAVVWQTRIGQGGPGGGIQWGIAYSPEKKLVFSPRSDRIPDDPIAGGGLWALDAATGKVIWHTPPPTPSCAGKQGCSGAQRSPPTVIPGAVISPSMDGHIRAFSDTTGEIIWDFDAVKDYTTTNGIPGRGGSFSSTGAVIVNGMLYINCGYSNMPGNVLLAFSLP